MFIWVCGLLRSVACRCWVVVLFGLDLFIVCMLIVLMRDFYMVAFDC